MSKAIPISMLEFGERIDLCLCCERGGGGEGKSGQVVCWYVGVMQNSLQILDLYRFPNLPPELHLYLI